jgi:hypothetical protein
MGRSRIFCTGLMDDMKKPWAIDGRNNLHRHVNGRVRRGTHKSISVDDKSIQPNPNMRFSLTPIVTSNLDDWSVLTVYSTVHPSGSNSQEERGADNFPA